MSEYSPGSASAIEQEPSYTDGGNTNKVIVDKDEDSEKNLRFLEELINELEDGELVPEADLLKATELGIDSLKASKQALVELKNFCDPVITVPEEYWDSLYAAGKMTAHMTWDGQKAIRGRINKTYIGTEDRPRAIFKVLPHVKISPRFTTNGKNSPPKFYGVFEVDSNNLPLVIGKDIIEIGKTNENTGSAIAGM